MQKSYLAILCLSSLFFSSACSTQNGDAVAAGASPAASQAVPADAANASNDEAAPPMTKIIVIPPRPKPGEPHGPGFDMPFIEIAGYTPSRPMDVLRDAHIFTADHPEVSSYVPCYCGCGSGGHKDNADCFVRQRDDQGRVTEWEPHGAACAVCIDIAVQSMRMRNSGASIAAIQRQVKADYRPRFPDTETPTPAPPPGK